MPDTYQEVMIETLKSAADHVYSKNVRPATGEVGEQIDIEDY